MMCEASENEVGENQHHPVEIESNTDTAETPIPNGTNVSHDDHHLNKSDYSNASEVTVGIPSDDNLAENNYAAATDDSSSAVALSNDNGEHPEDDNSNNEVKKQHMQANNDPKYIKPTDKRNSQNSNEVYNTEPPAEWNGHSNGKSQNESNQTEIIKNENGHGKSHLTRNLIF